MANDISPSIKLTVWRPVRWNREYLDVKLGQPADLFSFQQSVYSLEIQESPFDGIEDAEKTEIIRAALLDKFAPEVPHTDRTIEALSEVLSLISSLSQSGESSWSDSEQEQRLPGREKSNIGLRQHRLLALRSQLQWLYDTFRHVPDASITIR